MLSIRIEGSISGDFGKVDPRARKKAVFLSWVVINVECNRSCVLLQMDAMPLSLSTIFVLCLFNVPSMYHHLVL